MTGRCCLDMDEMKVKLWCGWVRDEEGADDRQATRCPPPQRVVRRMMELGTGHKDLRAMHACRSHD
jgi:hypothetical protein